MAVDVIFRSTYVNERNGSAESWRADIIDINAPSVLDTPSPFTMTERGAIIKWGSDRPLYEPIVASEVTMAVRIVGSSAFRTWAENTLPTEQENRYFLRLYRNSELDWTGVILQDRIEYFDRDVFEYTIRAICGLGRLKEVEPIDDFTRVGRVSLMREIANILDYASVYPLFLYNTSTPFLATNFKWFANEMPITLGTGDPTRYISYENLGIAFTVDEQTGKRVWRNLYDLLRSICINFGLTVTQAKGCWRVFQINDSTFLSNVARFYTYGWPITQGTNPATGAVHVITSYTTLSNLAEVPSNYKPLAATRNAFAPALRSVSASVLFAANGMVLTRVNDPFTSPATEPISFIQGLGLVGEFSTLIDIDPTKIPPFHNAYIVAKMSLSNTDGVNTRWLANSGQWFNGNVVQTFGDANSTPVSTTTPLPASFIFNFQTPQIPYIGDITFSVTYHLFDEVTQTEIAGGVIASSTTVTISTFVIDQSEARGLSVTLDNALTTQNSSIAADLGELLVIDRSVGNTYRACLIWNGTELVPSTTWKINDTGSSFLLYALVLRETLIRQQRPARQKEGAFIGTAYPYTRARYESTDNHIFVSGEYETGRKTWSRAMFQIIPTLTFTLAPILNAVIQASDPIRRGSTARRRFGDFVPFSGSTITLSPRVAGTGITTLDLEDPIGVDIPSGTTLTIADTNTGISYNVVTSSDTVASDTSIDVVAFDLPGDIDGWQIFFDQTTLIGLSGGGADTFIGLTDTPATYTANAIPSANAAGDALIWSILGQDTTTGADLERIIIKAPSGAGVRDVFTIFPNGQTVNKGFIIRDFGSGTQRLEVLVQRVAAISGNLTLWGASPTSDYVEIPRLYINPNAFFLTTERPVIRSLRPGYTGSSTVLFYGEEEEIILTVAAASQGATAVSVSMLSAKTWRASNYNDPASGSKHSINLGDTIFYKHKSFSGTNSSVAIIVVKGTTHIVDEPQNYIDRESVIVNEIDKQAGMGEFGFYAHKSNGGIFKQPLPTYADNDAAIAGGLTTDMWYKTSSGEVRIVV